MSAGLTSSLSAATSAAPWPLGGPPRERGFVCQHNGDCYYGIVHLPHPERRLAQPTGVMLLQGAEGDRCGPHRILVTAARRLADQGCWVLRWDLPDRGESEGVFPAAHWPALALVLDCGVRVIDRFLALSGCELLLAGGICVGAEYAIEIAKVDRRIHHLVLLSPQQTLFTGDAHALHRARLRHNLGRYLHKAMRPAAWLKLLSGRLHWRAILAALLPHTVPAEAEAGQGTERSAGEQGADLLARWRRNRNRLQAVTSAIAIYGERDPEAAATRAWLDRLLATNQVPVQRVTVAGADHNFCSPLWEQTALDAMVSWICEQTRPDPDHDHRTIKEETIP